MFLIKLIVELSTLLLLFVIIRKTTSGIRTLSDGNYSEAVLRRYKGEKRLYSVLFCVNVLIGSVICFWLIYGLFTLLHNSGHYAGVLVASQATLLIPSLVLGFHLSALFSPQVFVHVFGMSDFIFTAAEEEGKKSFARKLWKLFAVLPVSLALLLLAFQFNTYIKTDGENIYAREFGGAEQIYSVTQIDRIKMKESNSFEIYLSDGQKISTGGYSGNVNYFLDNLPL